MPLASQRVPAEEISPSDPSTTTTTCARRALLFKVSRGALFVGGVTISLDEHPAYGIAQRAVGSGEQRCRELNNCLETGEWDGAIGWDWGGKDRCDATDPLCGPNGQLRTEPIVGKLVPTLPSPDTVLTHVVAFDISIGREEFGRIQFGLYGNECPVSVSQLVDFLSDYGLKTLQDNADMIGTSSIPVSLTHGGIISNIEPSTYIGFGIPSQSNAYARFRGISPKNMQNFIPQPKPSVDLINNDAIIRLHDNAGLISIPYQGLGYGGSKPIESDDEVYETAFIITDNSIPLFDQLGKRRRRVIGQIIDPPSMAFLERLTNLPTKRGIRGVIPGQTSGPPLIKTLVQNVQVAKVVMNK